ncbi:MAG TPA: DNA translocase FtsK [Acetobacteraceae bacterium]|nr:DNA translocase FtsK [Acetobacteraceae bacterium]
MPSAAQRHSSPRSLASPAIQAIMRRRLGELGGLALGLAGIAVLIALATYNPRDPSPDTATSLQVTNLAGLMGAGVADVLLQGFGVAGGLPALAMLVWAWRIASHRGLGRLTGRVLVTLAAMPVLSLAIAAIPVPGLETLPWPTSAGPGGAAGQVLAGALVGTAQRMVGPLGGVIAWMATLPVALLLGFLSLGLSLRDWRAAGQGAADAARFSFAQSQRAVSYAGRLRGAVGGDWHEEEAEPAYAPEPVRPAPRRVAAEPAAETSSVLRRLTQLPPMAESEAEAEPPFAPPPSPARGGRPIALPSPAAAEPRVRAAQPARKSAARQEALSLPAESGWQFPPLSLLKAPPQRQSTGPSEDSLRNNARLLESVLADYGVQGQIRDIRPGPVVTLYELEPAPGIRSARVIGLADDVARSLSVTAVRIATVSGRNVIGIEVPNHKRETVFLSELLAVDDWQRHPGRLALALGKDIGGGPVVADLARMPHLLIAGTTGSGKSVGVNAMILSLLYRLSPDQCRLILIDPKMLELSVYDGIPHLMAPVVTEPAKAVTALKWTVREMERRYRAMSQLGVRNIGGYNERVEEARARGEVVTRRLQTGFDSETGRPTFEDQPLALEPLPFIVVVIDEMADLMMVAGKEIEAAVQRLAQMARAAGIHVIMATQRPSVDVITGTIKANFPTRISFQVISKFDSRTILGEQGAEQLLGQGDMLYMVGGGRVTRVHGPFVTDREVEEVVAFLRAQGEPAYVEEVTEAQEESEGGSGLSGIAGASDSEKSLFDQAVAVVAREGKASTSFIQRHLSIGYNRAAKLIEQMEKEGIVSAANHVGKREVLVRRTED